MFLPGCLSLLFPWHRYCPLRCHGLLVDRTKSLLNGLSTDTPPFSNLFTTLSSEWSTYLITTLLRKVQQKPWQLEKSRKNLNCHWWDLLRADSSLSPSLICRILFVFWTPTPVVLQSLSQMISFLPIAHWSICLQFPLHLPSSSALASYSLFFRLGLCCEFLKKTFSDPDVLYSLRAFPL